MIAAVLPVLLIQFRIWFRIYFSGDRALQNDEDHNTDLPVTKVAIASSVLQY
jgi:hypothetical protein